TRVSVNSLRIVQRELQMEEDALGREWDGLNALLGDEARPLRFRQLCERVAARNSELSTRIQQGDADTGDWAASVFEHVRQSVHDKAAIADPRLLT
ncbi:MAG TPA: DUF6285 domain-containing protein, partial [Dehalococcoidia bacterium]|nr:DUF6285 domain-containing protein [Dehalococcoidia bacterium]